jgi:hypothetical protein
MAADPGVAVDAAPAGPDNLAVPNGGAFRLTTPLGPNQTVELPGRVHVGAASGAGRVRLGASATGHYGAGPLPVPAAGDVAVDGVTVTATPAPPAPTGSQNPIGRKAPATAGAPAPTGSGGRKPGRGSAGVTGAAGSAASAAPAAPAPSVSAPPPTPAVEPAPAPAPVPASEPAPAPAPAPAPPVSRAPEQTAAPHLGSKGTSSDRGRWAWGGAAAVFLVAIAMAAVSRLLGGAARR